MTYGQKQFILEAVSTLRSVFLAFLVPFFGLIAYLFVNFDELSAGKIAVVVGGIIFCFGIVSVSFVGFCYYMKQVKELK